MNVLQIIFYVLALVLFVLAALNVASPRLGLGWAGLASWLIAAAFVPLLD